MIIYDIAYDEPSATCWYPEGGRSMDVQLYVLIVNSSFVLNYEGNRLHKEIFLIWLILERLYLKRTCNRRKCI